MLDFFATRIYITENPQNRPDIFNGSPGIGKLTFTHLHNNNWNAGAIYNQQRYFKRAF